MKKVVVSSILFALLSTVSVAETVSMSIGDWSPFVSMTDPNSQFLETVVTAALKLEGLDVTYKYLPWKRSFNKVQEGGSDGSFPWAKNKERVNNFYFH